LDGWQAGAMLLFIATGAILLAAPRGVAPTSIPPPAVDNAALETIERRDEVRARRVAREPLDVDVRALGREIRSYNKAAATGQVQELVEARAQVARATVVALRHDAEPLLALRAYQMLRFVAELRRWTEQQPTGDELAALGGDFIDTLTRNRWCQRGTRHLLLGDRVVRVLFKKRWNDLTGLRAGPFALSLDEDRVRFAFLIEHPFTRQRDADLRRAGKLAAAAEDELRLRLIGRLARRDPGYPADLARGVVLYQMGRYSRAGNAFRDHLERQPDGALALRARNYLKGALDRARAGPR